MRDRVNDFVRQYKSVRRRTLKLISVIEPEHLDFAYKAGKFTIADQIRHIAAIERYLYIEVLRGKESCYNGCGKELADGYDNILAFLHQTHEESLKVISRLRDDNLQEQCFSPSGHATQKGKWLALLLEHEVHHRAEIYLYLNLLDVQTPPMYGLTAEQVEQLSIDGKE